MPTSTDQYRPVYLVNVRLTLKHPPAAHRQQTTADNLLRLIYVLLFNSQPSPTNDHIVDFSFTLTLLKVEINVLFKIKTEKTIIQMNN